MFILKKNKIKDGMVENPTITEKIMHFTVVIMVLGIAFCSIIPMWHVVMASFSDGKSLLAHEGLIVLPVGHVTFEGYMKLFKDSNILRGYGNTIIYVIGATSIGMLINILGGYVLSRRTKLGPLLTFMVLITVLFNGGLIPTYMVIRSLGWVGTRWALLIPGATNGMFLVMMMTGFKSVPESTIEAARIDGAGHLRVLLNVMLPQTKSIATVIILNTVILQWNSWFNAAIYVTNKKEFWPLQLWIRQIVAENENFLNSANPDYGRYLVQFAIVIVATAPILIAFPFFQDRLEKGVIGGGVKG